MGKIGIYGGTFNPPHRGHMLAAREAVERLELDRLLLIPDALPPHKGAEEVLDGEERLNLLRLSTEELPRAEVSDMELRRGGISYTVDTVTDLAKMYPEDELVLLMGTDMFRSFPTWCRPDEICKMASLAVLYRSDKYWEEMSAQAEQLRLGLGAQIPFVKNDFMPLSSTELRRMLVFGCGESLMCPKAYRYVLDHGLYGVDRDRKGLSMEELEAEVRRLLAEKRVPHVLGVSHTAVELAKKYGADPVDARRAGLLHDITKLLSAEQQLILCREYGIVLDDFSKNNPKILHAITGAEVARRIFGENDRVCSAIRWHTTGKAGMNLLEKIIYTADYMEPNRNFDGVEELRRLAFADLDAAVCLGIRMSAEVLRRDGRCVSPDSEAAIRQLSK